MSSSARRSINWAPIFEKLQRLGAILTVAAIAAFGFWGGHFFLPGQEHAMEGEGEDSALLSSDEGGSVTLTEAKFTAASLKILAVQPEKFQAHRSIPGTIVYDATKKVEIRATSDCVVKEVLVQPTESVVAGQPILKLSATAIGAARSEISQCESSLKLLGKEYSWVLETHTNMTELLEFLDESPTPEQVRSRFENKSLGEHRNEILSAYSELALAKRLSDRLDNLKSQGAISGKEADERRSGLEVASAKFNAIREEMNFQTSQQLSRAKANFETGEKQLEICRKKLESLIGPQFADESAARPIVTEFLVVAPRAGQVVALPAVNASRFEVGEVMAEIADIGQVWVEAQISQRDWHAITVKQNETLDVRVPALPQAKFTCKVRHIGVSVSPTTMAIPLVAELNNEQNRFRPGMMIWVDVPVSEGRSTIAVPEGAIQRIESSTFVFVETAERVFEKRAVEIGERSGGSMEVLSGLDTGDRVVIEGAFFLTSELLLSEEE